MRESTVLVIVGICALTAFGVVCILKGINHAIAAGVGAGIIKILDMAWSRRQRKG